VFDCIDNLRKGDCFSITRRKAGREKKLNRDFNKISKINKIKNTLCVALALNLGNPENLEKITVQANRAEFRNINTRFTGETLYQSSAALPPA